MCALRKNQVLSVALFTAACVLAIPNASATDYYIDSVGGNDGNPGTNSSAAWASHTKAESATLSAGDTVHFKCGSSFTGPVEIAESGTAGSPIRLTSYGTGDLPKFTNPDASSMNGNCIRISGDYIVIEKLYFSDSPPCTGFQGWFRESGIFLNAAIVNMVGSDHNIIRDNVFTNCVKAVQSSGEYTLITRNYMDGPQPEQNIELATGWGPMGLQLGIGNQEVSYNTIVNFRYIGGTYGSDGGAIELDDGRHHKTNVYIHHNYTAGNAGFIESSWEYDNNPFVQEVLITTTAIAQATTTSTLPIPIRPMS